MNLISQHRTIIFSFLFSLSLAIETIISKIALNKGADPLVFSVEVLFFTAILLGFMLVLNFKQNFNKVTYKKFIGIILSGIIGLGFGAIVGKYGLQSSTATNYGFLFKSTLLFSATYGFFIFKEKLGKHFFILSLLFTLGCYLLITNGKLLKFHLGDLLILLSAFFVSSASCLNKLVLDKGMSALTVSFIRVSAGFLFWAVFIVLFLPHKLFLSLFFYAFLQSIFAVGTQIGLNSALKFGNISLVSLIGMSSSLFTTVLGIGLLKENLSLVQTLGAIIIFTSCIMLVKKYK